MIAARAWAALLAPPFVWYLQEQGLAGPLRINCHVADGLPAIAWGFVSLILCFCAGAMGWPIARAGRDTIAWIARVGAAGATIFSVAIAFGSMAAALVPACAR
jgi:hypothetical protein